MSSEDELIRRAQAGETDAFCLLAQAYERRIYSLAFHYCRDRQDAEDLSQEVWLKVYAALATFRNESTFYTWLRKITINCFLNHRRRRAKSFPWPRQSTDYVNIGDYPIKDGGGSAASLEITLQNHLAIEKVMQPLSVVTPSTAIDFPAETSGRDDLRRDIEGAGLLTGHCEESVSRTIAKLREQLGVDDECENYIW